ncbi:type II toxin-antitoxin system VapC family toxin [Algoriphagus limi]|uniref:Type II toxin-antitoxin system VapC family toxin n=1 Tax=Algoriphagus limi TaxID=2975273 RepID=A0ABT2G100_9BACT|nr:type II toxin-antitoxin system VapC family toxin [Algoriphagus limi]MCS5488849.1 type II toxin-antitoxin system VapC family toxin [Algoriphagus limi]
MKIFFDVNVVLDFFLERSPIQPLINQLFEKLENGQIQGFISISVIQTCIYYLAQAKDYETTKGIARICCQIFDFLDGDKLDVINALELDHLDIEDSIHYSICKYHQIEAIVTSEKDFLKLSNNYLPVLTPEELVRRLPSD